MKLAIRVSTSEFMQEKLGGPGGDGGVQTLLQASFPKWLRIIDNIHTLTQLTPEQAIHNPEGVSTAYSCPLQHPTSTQTSSFPSLATVPGG
jgi:hypothetical protein